MPLKSIKGGAWIPNRPPHLNAALSFTSTQLNSPGEKLAFIIQAPKKGTITKVCYYVQSVTSGGNVDIRLESVDAMTGLPSGNPWGTNTNKVEAIGAGWRSTTLTAAAANVPAGEYLAIVISPYLLSAADFQVATINPVGCAQEFPYSASYLYPGPSWSKLQNCPVCALEYDDGGGAFSYEVIQGAWPIKAINNVSFNSGSPLNQRGLRFKLPFPARVVGAWVWADIAGDADLKLYSSADVTTAIANGTIELDKDRRFGTTYARQEYYFLNSNGSPVELAAQREYFLVLAPKGLTNVILNEVDVNSVAVMDAMDGGREFYHASRAGAGAFTPNTNKRPMMGLILDQFSDGALGYFDVTLPPYNAKGDGSNDDTAEIQLAFTDAAAAGAGSTIYITRGAGAYIVDSLNLAGDNLRLTGDGTLKLKNASTAFEVLKITGHHNFVSGIRIDGNRAGIPTSRAFGIDVTGNYNHVRDVAVFNTRAAGAVDAGVGVYVSGHHNLVEQVWVDDAGGAALYNAGNFNRYQDCSAKNWSEVGFYHAALAIDRLDIDGCYFEPGTASTSKNCMWFAGASLSARMVAIRNTIVEWPTGIAPDGALTQVLGKFTQIERLILDNCLFRHKNTAISMLSTVEIGAGVKRAYIDHTFLSRQLKLTSLDADAVIMLVDTQIGDDQLWASPNTQPTVSVSGVGGAQFIARMSRFAGYTASALQLESNLETGSMVHFEAADCDFNGYQASTTTYDVGVFGLGALNYSRRILWLNNRRTNTASGGTADTAAGTDIPKLFTTRDWSKRVLQWASSPTSTTEIKWQVGDTIMYPTPITNGYIGKVCVTGGLTSVWKEFGHIL